MPDLLLPASYHQRPGHLVYNRGPNSGFWYQHGAGSDGASTRWRASRWRTPEDHGAVGNGTTDDTSALNALRDAVQPGDGAYFAPGKVYRYHNTADHYYWNNKDGVTLYGRNSRIHSTYPTECGMQFEQADDVWIEGLTLSTDMSTLPLPGSGGSRGGSTHHHRLTVWACNNFTGIDVRVQGSYAAGIYLWHADYAQFIRPHVRNTRADGFHITGPSKYVWVDHPQVHNVGDDMVAVVSYASDGAPCQYVTVEGGVMSGQYNGRGITVVGGLDIEYLGNRVYNSRAAGALIYVEAGDFVTTEVQRVVMSGNEFVGCSQAGSAEGHPAVLLGNWGGSGKVCNDIEFSYNIIQDVPGPKLPMRIEGSSTDNVTNVRAFGNQIYGSFTAGAIDGWITKTDSGIQTPTVTGIGESHGTLNIPSNRVRAY